MLFAAFVISLEWLETYSVEGWGSAGTNKRLKYAKEQDGGATVARGNSNLFLNTEET